MKYYLFAYGSLKKGGQYHSYLDGASFAGNDTVEGYVMTDLGEYPMVFATNDKSHIIMVETYEIDESMLPRIDELEGYNGPGCSNEYERIAVKSRNGAEGFLYTGTDINQYKGFPVVESGNWPACPERGD